MGKKQAIFLAAIFLLGSGWTFALTNPGWVGGISQSPTLVWGGQVIAFSAQFKVKRGVVNDLYVVARIDGAKVLEKTYGHLNVGDEETVAFTWTAVAGTHHVAFVIDPDNQVPDSNRGNNVVEKDFVVEGRGAIIVPGYNPGKPDLEVRLYSVNPSPVVGDTIELSAKVTNVGGTDSAPCGLRFSLEGGSLPPDYRVPLPIKPDRHFEITIAHKLDRVGTYHFKAELIDSYDQNQGNNASTLAVTPRAPDLAFTKVDYGKYNVRLGSKLSVRVWIKNQGDADSGPFELDADFEPCKGLAQARSWTRVKNLRAGEEISHEFTHRFFCIGLKYNRITIDKGNSVIEHDESNNGATFGWIVQ